jgi:PKD repeat protein
VDVTISASSTAICEGESVTLSTNQNFTSYSWTSGQNTNAISISQAGTYSLNVTDARGCSGVSNSINIEVMDSPVAGYEYSQTTGYTIVFNNTSIHGNTYLWIFHNNTTSTEENPSFTYPFDAVYPITLIAFNDCGSDTIFENVIVDKISSVNDLNSLSNLNIFPNPSNGIFTLEGQSNGAQQYKFRVLNMLGQEIHSSNISVHGQWNKTLDLKLYSKGVYWIIIEDNKTKLSRKLVLM